MKSTITSLINEAGTQLGPIEGTSRHMAIQITGTAGTITGSISVDGETFTDIDTYSFTGPTETLSIEAPAAGIYMKLTTTGTFTAAYLITEG